MIAVDASAILAIAFDEEGAADFERILTTTDFAIGWPTVFEARIGLTRLAPAVAESLWAAILGLDGANLIPFAEPHYLRAEQAFKRYGKGRGHPAQLNFGDCMAYAVAKELGAPILFKGSDFDKTDLEIHPASAIV